MYIINNIMNHMITWLSCVHSIRVILMTAKVLTHQIWYQKPLFVLNGNGTEHMSNVMGSACASTSYAEMVFWRDIHAVLKAQVLHPNHNIADSSAVDGLRLALLDGGVTLGW